MQPTWVSKSYLGTFAPSTRITNYQLVANNAVLYTLLSGSLPIGVAMTNTGLLYGTPSAPLTLTTYTFTVRVTGSDGEVADRTFTADITAGQVAQLTLPSGVLATWDDSTWVDYQLGYINPFPDIPVKFEIREGFLPPGLELSISGRISGYAAPPTLLSNGTGLTTQASKTTVLSNIITCISVTGFVPGRPIIFSKIGGTITSGSFVIGTRYRINTIGSTNFTLVGASANEIGLVFTATGVGTGTGTVSHVIFGNIILDKTYYIHSVIDINTFKISEIVNGPEFILISQDLSVTITLPGVTIGQPINKNYPFIVQLDSELGEVVASYSINIRNQCAPLSQGGLGHPAGQRPPVILNTHPRTQSISPTDPYYGYYKTPGTPFTDIGVTESGDYFSFKILGHDFDTTPLVYTYYNLPPGLTGNATTGWITGTPTIGRGFSGYIFSVSVKKIGTIVVSSAIEFFRLKISSSIQETVTWHTPADLGVIQNSTTSTLAVSATADVPLEYRVVSGSLPPHLELLSNGEITGFVADQPTNMILTSGDSSTFTFSVEAFSPDFSLVTSTRTFTIVVTQSYVPTDIVYVQAAPSVADRHLLTSLLSSTTLIPDADLYRPTDQYFGKATSVIYNHLYGVMASDIDEYIAAASLNHYHRNITLGELKTAKAKNSFGEVVYEVVYSAVYDDLANIEPDASEYNSIVDPEHDLVRWKTPIVLPDPLAPIKIVYPNSLRNMQSRLSAQLGREYDSRLLPLWMTSQQDDGSTLGFTAAWVICFTLPGKSAGIRSNIEAQWPHKLNQINFHLDRFIVNKSNTYNYDKKLVPAAWTSLPSSTPVPGPLNSQDYYVLFPRKTILPL
jgi:hypothetical protein